MQLPKDTLDSNTSKTIQFESACHKALNQSIESKGIGTLKEKTIHAVLKNFYAPDVSHQEQRIEGFVADIFNNGEIIEIPEGCVLDFQGGSFFNGTIILDNTKIKPNGCVLNDFFQNITIQGNFGVGQCVFDTTLNKPKWWTGTKWVDATGADV